MSQPSTSPRALIIWGGWEGHEPEQIAHIWHEDLCSAGYEVTVANRLEILREKGDALQEVDLICPIWTMGHIDQEDLQAVDKAIQSGVGLAGCHGGMCDAFRNEPLWQFMTGGQWVAHPGDDGIEYEVVIVDKAHPICEGLPDFKVVSEQYYMHVDPANHVLATTRFPIADGPHIRNGPVEMPIAWTRMWGDGRVFYSSLGHHADIIASGPAREMIRRGLVWATKPVRP